MHVGMHAASGDCRPPWLTYVMVIVAVILIGFNQKYNYNKSHSTK